MPFCDHRIAGPQRLLSEIGYAERAGVIIAAERER